MTFIQPTQTHTSIYGFNCNPSQKHECCLPFIQWLLQIGSRCCDQLCARRTAPAWIWMTAYNHNHNLSPGQRTSSTLAHFSSPPGSCHLQELGRDDRRWHLLNKWINIHAFHYKFHPHILTDGCPKSSWEKLCTSLGIVTMFLHVRYHL